MATGRQRHAPTRRKPLVQQSDALGPCTTLTQQKPEAGNRETFQILSLSCTLHDLYFKYVQIIPCFLAQGFKFHLGGGA
jgi:hypothetical protein